MWSISEDDEDLYLAAHVETQDDVVLTRESVKTRKPKLKPPTILERIFGKELTKTRYLTAGVNINETNQRNILNERSPFKYPEDLEEFSYRVMTKAWRYMEKKKEKELKYDQRQSSRSRQTRDLLNRLWVKDPKVKGCKTMLDLDPQFLTVFESCSVAKTVSHKDYIKNLRDVLRKNIVIQYKEDEILLIDETCNNEQNALQETKKEFQKYVDTFEIFLFNDHTTAITLLEQAERETCASKDLYQHFKEFSQRFGLLKASLYNVEEKWRRCKMYQRFLYTVSPVDWRKQHDFYVKNYTRGSIDSRLLDQEDSASSIFDRYKLEATQETYSLVNLMDQFLDDVKEQQEPLLYFSDPTELIKVFTFMELQNLGTLMHIEELVVPLQQVDLEMNRIYTQFDNTATYLTDIINSLEGGIIWEEKREAYLEQLALELINGDFKELISNAEIINLYVFVEDVYETRIGRNEDKLSVADMMEIIEGKYLEYNLMLDRLPADMVLSFEMQYYAEQVQIMVNAKKAARKLVQVEIMMKQLAKIFTESTTYKQQRELKWRSPLHDKPKRPPPPPEPISEEAIEYLTYFVDDSENVGDPRDQVIKQRKKDAEESGINEVM